MTKDELWTIYVKQNPALAAARAAEITLPVSGFRKMFDLTYDQAFAAGQAALPAPPRQAGRNPFEDLFGKRR